MFADVVGLLPDCSIPLNVVEEVYMVTIALPRQLYDEDVASDRRSANCSLFWLHLLELYMMIMPELIDLVLVLD